MKNKKLKIKFDLRKVVILSVLFAVIPILAAVVLSTSYSVSPSDYEVKSNGLGTLTLTWLEGTESYAGKIDENGVLQINPTANNIYNATSNTGGGARASYQLVFNMGGSEKAQPGEITIKIPRYLFFDRNDQPIKDQIVDIPLVEAPQNAGTGFNYTFETDADGNDYIVLKNFEEIPPSYTFEASLTWILKNPSTVKNGYTKDVKGTLDIDLDEDGNFEDSSTSNTIQMKYNSHVEVRSVTKKYTTHIDPDAGGSTNVFSSWKDEWVDELKPEDADKYVYAVTYAYAYVYYATQPYTITFTDTLTDDLGGEVIGYCRYSSYNDTTSLTGRDSGDYCFSKTNTGKSESSGSYSHAASATPLSATVTSPSSSYDYFDYFYFLVKYPKEKMQDSQTHEMKNTVTATAKGVDGDESSVTANLTKAYTYSYIEPKEKIEEPGFIPNRYITNSKYGSRTVDGGINMLESNKDGFTIDMGYTEYSSRHYNYSFGGSIQDYQLTLKDGGSASNPEDYGKKEWTAGIEDDVVIFGNSDIGYKRIGYKDYEMTALSVYSYTVYDYEYAETESYNPSTKVTTKTKGYQYKSIDYANAPEIEVYYKVDGDTWLSLGKIKFTDSSHYTFTGIDGTSISATTSSSESPKIPLPEGTTAVKGEVKSHYGKINLTFRAKMRIVNSELLRSIVENQDNARVYNFSTAFSRDDKGTYYGTFESSTYNSSCYDPLESTYKELIEELDKEMYGRVMGHGYDKDSYTRIKGGATHQNKWVTYTNDAANRRIRANYTAYAVEYLTYDNTILDSETVLKYNLINEQRVGTFYDLLPLGMTVDVDTVKVQMFKDSSYTLSSSYDEAGVGTEIPSTVSFIDNWQNSGQMMMIVKAVVPDELDNYYTIKSSSSSTNNTSRVFSGMTLRFIGNYSWDSFYDYGTSLTNTVAYKSGNGRLSDGYPDDAETQTSLVLKEYMSDLDQDGNPVETTINDTVYAQRTMVASFNTASDAAFNKGVKTANMQEYVDGRDGSVIVAGGGYYTYRLRFASQRNTTTTGLIIYDDLEVFDDGEHERWQGTLRNVDISQILAKGIDAKVYYSTKKNMNLYENGKASVDKDHPKDSILTDESIWSLTPPENMKDVTAIAIDCSKKTDGSEYKLEPEESVVAILTMQAPVENVKALEAKNAKALNAAWWSGITQQLSEPSHDNFTVFEWTEVGIKDVEIDIDKESYVPSGTKEKPAVVKNGDLLTYDIIVKNKGTWATINNVLVRDILPKEVSANLDDVAYYIEGEGSFENSTLVSDSGLVQMTADGQTLDFRISQLLSGEVLHILIPTVVHATTSDDIENKASILEFNNETYVSYSPTTHHKVNLGSLTILKRVFNGDRSRKYKFKITLIDPLRKEEDYKTPDKVETEEQEEVKDQVQPEQEEQQEPVEQNETNDNDVQENDDSNVVPGDVEIDQDTSSEEVEEEKEVIYDPLNTVYSDVTFTDGVGYVYLADGETKTIEGLPDGFLYKVEEEDVDGWTVKSKNEKGTILASKDIKVEFNNIYILNPNTGDLFIFVVIALVVSAITMFILKKIKVKRYV